MGKTLLVIGAVVVLIAILAAGYKGFKHNNLASTVPSYSTTNTTSNSSSNPTSNTSSSDPQLDKDFQSVQGSMDKLNTDINSAQDTSSQDIPQN
jgi:hypothetical protein